ncbi:hypothetical protein D3C85_1714230 [compost metagenome]
MLVNTAPAVVRTLIWGAAPESDNALTVPLAVPVAVVMSTVFPMRPTDCSAAWLVIRVSILVLSCWVCSRLVNCAIWAMNCWLSMGLSGS